MSFSKNKIIIIGFLLCALFIVYNGMYTVSEGQVALLVHSSGLEKTNSQSPYLLQGPGLHFKMPFFVQSIPINRQIQTFSAKKLNILTADGHQLIVDYYVKWQVTNPLLYYSQTNNDVARTQQQFAQEINTFLQNEYTHNTLNNIINNKQPSTLNSLLMQINTQSKALGITLVDIGIQSMDFPTETDTALLKSKRAEQALIALQQRAIGKANAENIRANADNQASLFLAKTKEEAAIIRGEGDAIAAKIYNDAYHKNLQFAAFYLNLETYRKGFMQSSPSNNFLVLNTQDGFFSPTKGFPTKYPKDLG
ncbi:MAG: protease modulator HflC [Pseudomonadota bacterium]